MFRFASTLVESSIMHKGWALSGRAERTNRPESERLRGTRVAPFLEVARAAARAQRTPAVFVPAEFYGSATPWSLSLGARIHAGPMRRRMGRYVLPADARPSAFTASPTHP